MEKMKKIWRPGSFSIALLTCMVLLSGNLAASDGPCCGSISEAGRKLSTLLDQMHVEEHWLAHEHVNWETGVPDRGGEYEGPGHTHCSAFAAAVGKKLDIYLLRPPEHAQKLLANAQAEWLAGSEGRERGWSAVNDGREAQALANQGNLVVVVFANSDPGTPGHVAIVRPSEKSIGRLEREGPEIIQAGEHNHNSTTVKQGFETHPGAFPSGVRYYSHTLQVGQ
jgi:hypothetical protein